MQSFEHIQCRSLSIVDKHGIQRVRISTDDNGGRIDIASKHEKGGGFVLSFDTGQPSIAILNKDGKLCINLSVDAEGGFLNIIGKDGKTKITLTNEQRAFTFYALCVLHSLLT